MKKREVIVIDRKSKLPFIEKILGEKALHFLYPEKESKWTQFLSSFIAKSGWISSLYGAFHKTPFSKKKISSFIHNYKIDASEFEKEISDFTSFNDFFIRTLKKESRPLDTAEAILPADARYLFFTNIKETTFWDVKGRALNLKTLLKNPLLSQRYEGGTAIFARLCPVDYHRFHFPCSGTPSEPKCINGPLYSVHPWSLFENIERLQENKRKVTLFHSDHFKIVTLVEIGATNVGSIKETFEPNTYVLKGTEKGYFSLGGSALLLLFEKDTLQLAPDLLPFANTSQEVYGKWGEALGSICLF